MSAAFDISELPALVKLLFKRMAVPKEIQTPAPQDAASDKDDLLLSKTAFLRDERHGGRLSVRSVAQLDQVPKSRLAAALQVSRSAVAQTSTSARYQNFWNTSSASPESCLSCRTKKPLPPGPNPPTKK